MSELPLHPALVHVPIGLSVLLPLLSAGVSLALWREKLPKRTWLIIVLSSLVALLAAFAAKQTGEAEEERVEEWVPHGAIHDHEEAAEAFIWVLGATTLASAALFLFKKPRVFKVGLAVVTLGYVAVLALALNVGREGGELVYRHNAGASRAPSP